MTEKITPLSEKIKEKLEKDKLQFNNKDGSIHHDGESCLSEFCPCFLHGKIMKAEENSRLFKQALKNFCEEIKSKEKIFWQCNECNKLTKDSREFRQAKIVFCDCGNDMFVNSTKRKFVAAFDIDEAKLKHFGEDLV